MSTIEKVVELAEKYMAAESIPLLRKAYDFASQVYADNPDRKSGEPYISHPVAVAEILASMKLDVHTVISGLLHKVLRGNPVNTMEADLAEYFGASVAAIVRGATRIDDIQFNSKLDYKAENVKKMLLAISADIRVLLVKLADHLHDMRTLQYVDPQRQRELAKDTMDLYAPMTSRLGIDWLKRELEDLSFQYLHPRKHAELSNKIEMSLPERENFVEKTKADLDKRFQAHGIKNYRILGRPKHLYSIYRKLVAQNIPIEKVYDKVAFRVIVQEVSECYEVMGLVHALWQPVASRFKDFISAPKANLYQSLHTSVVGPDGDFMEIQIRTEDMDEIANDGIAAHWAYKEGSDISKKDALLFHWLKQLVQNLQDVDDSQEVLETVIEELDYSVVYALTPNGDVKELLTGSTPLDFAYSIHTEVGHRCTGVKVNDRIVPLKYEIQNGDVIEIITSSKQHPNRGWLSLVKTSRAKSRIRHWLKQDEQAKLTKGGKEICERELRKYNLSLKRLVKTGHIRNVLKRFGCNVLDELLRRIGSGSISIQALAAEFEPPEIREERLRKQAEEEAAKALEKTIESPGKSKKNNKNVVRIDGIEDMLVKLSNCCMPMPGDSIAGFITAGRGVSVHKINCINFLASDPQRHVDVEWCAEEQGTHRAKIQVFAQDRKGLLVSLCNLINGEDADILDVEAHSSSTTSQAQIDLVIAVSNRDHLAAILRRIRQMGEVLEARRK